MKGRPPRPREQRIREGATRNLPEPVVISGRVAAAEALEPPTDLSKDALKWWEEVVPTLAEAAVIERIDVYALTMAAYAWAEVVACERVIKAKGMFTIGSVGNMVVAPWLKARRDAMLTFERYLNHIALSPVARARLGLAHLRGRALMREMDEALGAVDADAEIIEAEDLDAVGLPGV